MVPAADPFATLLARALGVEVEAVDVATLEREEEVAGAETQRVRWRGGGREGSVLFRRYPVRAAVEAAVLPLLSRRGAPVPQVFASGVPPRHAPEARPWLLLGDPGDRVAAPPEALAALARTRAAIARDVTTLASLGVPQLPPERVRDEALWAEELLEPEDFARLERLAAATDVRRLAAIESGLAHGALEGNAVATADGAILLGWSRAHLGCPLIDDPAGDDDARRLAALFAVRWLVWEAREMLRARRPAADLVRAVLVQYT